MRIILIYHTPVMVNVNNRINSRIQEIDFNKIANMYKAAERKAGGHNGISAEDCYLLFSILFKDLDYTEIQFIKQFVTDGRDRFNSKQVTRMNYILANAHSHSKNQDPESRALVNLYCLFDSSAKQQMTADDLTKCL